jgi:spermidine synthase
VKSTRNGKVRRSFRDHSLALQLLAGQAMTLKVNRILHVEKSKYQDVLVFDSETFGNVLVLDGVIQCTERDEFSYVQIVSSVKPDPDDPADIRR